MATGTAVRRGGGRPRNLTRPDKGDPEYDAWVATQARASDRRNASARAPRMRPADPDTPDEGAWSRPASADDPAPAPAPSSDDSDDEPDPAPAGPGVLSRHFGSGAGAGETGGGLVVGAIAYALLMALINYGAGGPSAWFKAKFLNKPTPVPGKTTAKPVSAPAGTATGVLT